MKHSTTKKGNTMQIQLNQNELKDAVRLFVTSELKMDLTGKTLNTTFTATRGDLGIITNLDIQKTGAGADIEIPGFTAASPEVVAAANGTAAPTPAPTAISATDAPATEAEETAAAGQAELAAMKAAQPKPPVDKGTPAPVTVATLEATAPVVAGTPTPATVDPSAVAGGVDQTEVVTADTPAPEVKPAATTSLFG